MEYWEAREEGIVLTPCESMTMQCVWKMDTGGLFTEEEVMEKVHEVYQKNWTKTNGSAFLGRLKKKGLVGRKWKGFKKYYYCKMSMEEARRAGVRERDNGWYRYRAAPQQAQNNIAGDNEGSADYCAGAPAHADGGDSAVCRQQKDVD